MKQTLISWSTLLTVGTANTQKYNYAILYAGELSGQQSVHIVQWQKKIRKWGHGRCFITMIWTCTMATTLANGQLSPRKLRQALNYIFDHNCHKNIEWSQMVHLFMMLLYTPGPLILGLIQTVCGSVNTFVYSECVHAAIHTWLLNQMCKPTLVRFRLWSQMGRTWSGCPFCES